jgi:ADP-ribose pyrophosphatase YjhB (NUDIX family)
MNSVAAQTCARKTADADTRIGLGVGVFVLDAARRGLLEERSACALYGLPGRGVKAGESLAQTAARQVLEEIGRAPRIGRSIGVYSEPEDHIVVCPDNGDVVQKTDAILEADVVSGVLARSRESEELRFFEIASMSAGEDICPPARQPIADSVQGRSGVLP